MEDTCIIEPDLEENEIGEKEVAAKTGDIEQGQFWQEFPEIQSGTKKDQGKEKENAKESVWKGKEDKDVELEVKVEDTEKEEVDEVEVQEVDDEVEEAVGEVEVEVDEVEEEIDEVEEQDVDDEVKEVGFAAQAVASLGYGLGITVHGSALVFPAIALPRLKQVSFQRIFQNYVLMVDESWM